MHIKQSVKNVCSEVSSHGLCVGCGVCAGVCPTKTLSVEFDVRGQLTANDVLDACIGCGICLKSCPFWHEQQFNEDSLGKYLFSEMDGIKYDAGVGYFIQSMCGYSKISGHRENGASGGMATWFLENLLLSGLVDKVCCVRPMDKVGQLFSFVVCSSVDEIRDSSRSCYYPVESSNVINFILNNCGRYAIVGLPCLVKSLRLAMKINRKLQERITFIVGLVCGQGKGAFFSEYICALGGGDPLTLDSVRFRMKDHSRGPKDHGIRFSCSSRTTSEFSNVKYMSEGPGKIWTDRYFTPVVCNFCDDTFAELADVVFMDAWLPQFEADSLGNSLLLIRNPKALELLRRGAYENELSLSETGIDEVVMSQYSLLRSKRDIVQYRCRLAKNYGYRVPRKRGVLSLGRVTFWEKQLVRVTLNISIKSSTKWFKSNRDIEKFNKSMFLLRKQAIIFRKIEKMVNDPIAIIKRVLRRVIRR